MKSTMILLPMATYMLGNAAAAPSSPFLPQDSAFGPIVVFAGFVISLILTGYAPLGLGRHLRFG
jgi:hypothetical protein